MGDEDRREAEAPFNMAIATLKRLDAILQQIRNLQARHPIDSAEKQKSHIGLVKAFYINAVPLLSDDETKNYKDKVLKLELSVKNKIKSGTQRIQFVYDKDIDYKLNEILVELQQKLKKFFMPKGKDPGKSVHFG